MTQYVIPLTFKSLNTLERYFSSILSSILFQISVENLFTFDGNHKHYDEINHKFTIINRNRQGQTFPVVVSLT